MKQEDLLKNRVDLSDLMKLQESVKEAEKDDTPFAVVNNGEVNVAGDVNKTEVKSKNYNIRFRFPKSMASNIDEKDIIETLGGYVIVNIEFTDVHITPRRDIDIAGAVVTMLPYIKKIQDNKSEYRTEAELLELTKGVSKDIGDDMYEAVAAVLNVDDSIKDYMMFTDVMDMVAKLPYDFPELFNESDSFFGKSSQEK